MISGEFSIKIMHLSCTISKISLIYENEKWSHNHKHTHLGVTYHEHASTGYLPGSICTPNFKSLVSKYKMWGQNFKMDHITLTSPYLGLSVAHMSVLAMINLYIKYENSSFTHSKCRKDDPKFTKRDGLGWLGSIKVIRHHLTFCSPSIPTLYCF